MEGTYEQNGDNVENEERADVPEMGNYFISSRILEE